LTPTIPTEVEQLLIRAKQICSTAPNGVQIGKALDSLHTLATRALHVEQIGAALQRWANETESNIVQQIANHIKAGNLYAAIVMPKIVAVAVAKDDPIVEAAELFGGDVTVTTSTPVVNEKGENIGTETKVQKVKAGLK